MLFVVCCWSCGVRCWLRVDVRCLMFAVGVVGCWLVFVVCCLLPVDI